MGFVFTNFQADNYGTSSGDDEGNCVYNACMLNVFAKKVKLVVGWGEGRTNVRHIPVNARVGNQIESNNF